METERNPRFEALLKKLGAKYPGYSHGQGGMLIADSLKILEDLEDASVDLVLTSPPFLLQRQKEYGNKLAPDYLNWFMDFAELVHKKLKDSGSFVVDLGGAYEKAQPVRSLYNYRLPIKLCDDLGFFLAEEFFWYNPSKLPGPIEWVNKRKIRVKDAVNTLWWFSKTQWPKADVSRVLKPYSEKMQNLLKDPPAYYAPTTRPSGHAISEGFAKDNGGAIPSNLLQLSNSDSRSLYLRRCKVLGIKPHPARFPEKLPEFFIKLLTDEGDLVVDIFAGSNTTGLVAASLNRSWLSIEASQEYAAASFLRFLPEDLCSKELKKEYQALLKQKTGLHSYSA